MNKEKVVLVDEKNNILGTMLKPKVHGKSTPLHRAFSVFIFNKNGELLLQQRSQKKKTWPGVWSNSCCGHPRLNENNIKAAKRRINQELGLKVKSIKEIAPYRYKFSQNGVMENEICPILVGLTSNKLKVKFNKKEVKTVGWLQWKEFLKDIKRNPRKYSPWAKEQVKILNKNKEFKKIIKN